MAETHTTLIMQLLMILLIKSGNAHDQCRESYCGPNQPLIKFPFQIVKESSQDQCVYPKEFCLYCTENKKTMIVLSTSSGPIKFHVSDIDYESHSMSISDPDNCLPKKFLILNNSSFRPYRFDSELDIKIFFFNCFSVRKQHLRNQYQTSQESQDMITCPIYVADSDEDIVDLDLLSCTKMFDVNASMMGSDLRYNFLRLSWPKQSCAKCESKGMKCKWMNNTTKPGIECFYCNQKHKKFQPPKALIFSAIGSIILGMGTIVFIKIYLHFREKEEDQVRIDKFLEDYRAQKPARFSYSDIKRITSGFKEKLGEGAHGSVFKGKLSSEILVAVKILNNTQGEGKEFITEVEIMGKIHHLNVVRLLGFCADGFRRALVYDFFPNGSLQKFISHLNNKDDFLGWDKLQQIALGIANGIEYLHQGCDQRILHFDINPHNILLDDNFTPKITDFGLAKMCSKNQSNVSMTAAKGTLGYMAPEVFSRNFGNVSYKSDIYSYGMLLLEMVGGRKNTKTTSGDENIQVEYPDWIHNLFEGDIQIPIDEERDFRIPKKLATVGLWCIQWHPLHRPTMKSVIKMLQAEADKLKVPTNPFGPTTKTKTNSNIVAERMNLELEVIEEIE